MLRLPQIGYFISGLLGANPGFRRSCERDKIWNALVGLFVEPARVWTR